MTRPALTRLEADAIAERVRQSVVALGVRLSTLHIEEVPSGLLIVARVGDRSGACLVPSGHTVNWRDIGLALVAEIGAPFDNGVLVMATH